MGIPSPLGDESAVRSSKLLAMWERTDEKVFLRLLEKISGVNHFFPAISVDIYVHEQWLGRFLPHSKLIMPGQYALFSQLNLGKRDTQHHSETLMPGMVRIDDIGGDRLVIRRMERNVREGAPDGIVWP